MGNTIDRDYEYFYTMALENLIMIRPQNIENLSKKKKEEKIKILISFLRLADPKHLNANYQGQYD